MIFRINFKLQSKRSKRFKLEKLQIENELNLKQRELFNKSNLEKVISIIFLYLILIC